MAPLLGAVRVPREFAFATTWSTAMAISSVQDLNQDSKTVGVFSAFCFPFSILRLPAAKRKWVQHLVTGCPLLPYLEIYVDNQSPLLI